MGGWKEVGQEHQVRWGELSRGADRRGQPGAMLVLTRKLGEIVRVGEAITVRVLEVKGNQVRRGVEGPADVRIYREEVYQAIQKEHEAVAVPDAGGLAQVARAAQSARQALARRPTHTIDTKIAVAVQLCPIRAPGQAKRTALSHAGA